MYSDYKNKMFVDKFFEKHKVFSCKNLHWDVSNDQLRNRIKYLFSEYGFFNYILKENLKFTSSNEEILIQSEDFKIFTICTNLKKYPFK